MVYRKTTISRKKSSKRYCYLLDKELPENGKKLMVKIKKIMIKEVVKNKLNFMIKI